MRKMKTGEIKSQAKKIADSWLAGYSLVNAKKIALEVRRLLLTEEQRRKPKKDQSKIYRIKFN